jgi:hypothetical protein
MEAFATMMRRKIAANAWFYMDGTAQRKAVRDAIRAGETVTHFAHRLGVTRKRAETVAGWMNLTFPSAPAHLTAEPSPAAERPLLQSPLPASDIPCPCLVEARNGLVEATTVVGRHALLFLICPCTRERRWTHRQDAR